MNAKTLLSAALISGLTLGIPTTIAADDDGPIPIPATPAPVGAVLSIQPFTLGTPVVHEWRFEKEQYDSGYIMVIEVDPALALNRQIAHPVLYVGNQVAEVVNMPQDTGRAVVIVPAELEDRKAPDYLDLDNLRIFYGDPELPENVDAVTIRQQQQWATRAGIRPVPADQIQQARLADGPMIRATKLALLGDVAAILRAYSPTETKLAEEYELAAGH